MKIAINTFIVTITDCVLKNRMFPHAPGIKSYRV